jgi:hypothetical protein
VRRTKIALALAVVVTALALPGSALPQALIIGHVDRVAAWCPGDRRSSAAGHLSLGRHALGGTISDSERPTGLASRP